ncbi:MAG: hypothetical protein QOH60_4450 [Mycobacterium sp.]|jgi:hypothetical protein|nr:hypothetical protein [Mycobacterium sp.]
MTASAKRLLATSLVSSLLVVIAGCADPHPELPAKLTHDFTNKADGPVESTADTSQWWTQTGSSPQAAPAVVNAGFTDADTQPGPSASYLTVRLREPVTHVAAEFDFGPTGTDGENVTLIASSKNLPGGTSGAGPATDLAMHLAFTETGWIYSTVSGGSMALTTLKSVDYGSYRPETALQKVSVVLDAANNRATVHGADGKVTDVVDPSIGAVRSPYITFEVYYGAANTDKRAFIRKVQADSLTGPSS